MISFRYHLVTIVGLFLALGLGVLAGTTVIDQQLVEGLKSQIQKGNEREAQRSADLIAARGRLERQEQALQDLADDDLGARLAGRPVVLVSGGEIDPQSVERICSDLERADADVQGSFRLTGRIYDQGARDALQDIVPGAAEDPGGAVATALLRRLTDGPGVGADPMEGLLGGGFLVTSGGEGPQDVAAVGGPGQVVVLVGGGTQDPAVSQILAPLARGLSDHGMTVGVGEEAATSDGLVFALRNGQPATGPMVTVDNVDEAAGRYALVVALQQLVEDRRGGDFGFKPGATSLTPPPR